MRTEREPLRLVVIVTAAEGEESTAGSPRDTAKELAALADAESVSLTWALDLTTSRRWSAWLNRRNETPHDDLILMAPTKGWLLDSSEETGWANEAERLVSLRETLPQRLSELREAARRRLPWSTGALLGAEWKETVLIQAAELAGFRGLWGYRWNELSGRAADRGAPFGFFYPALNRHPSAGAPAARIVGVPRFSPNLPLLRRLPPEPTSAAAELPIPKASDPSEPSLSDLRTILQRTAEQAPLNQWNVVVQCLSLEQLESAGDAFTSELVETWRLARELGYRPTRLLEAVNRYADRFPLTEPTVAFTTWQETLDGEDRQVTECYYYDDRLQIVVEEGSVEPANFHNYVSAPSRSVDLTEPELPELREFLPSRHRDRLILDFSLESPKPMPYALLLWEDHRHLRLVEGDLPEVRWLGKEGLLLLLDLEPGVNSYHLVLSI